MSANRNHGQQQERFEGPIKYVVAAAPTVIFLALVALVYFVLL